MLNVCYSPDYISQTHTNSMEKLKAVADRLKKYSVIQWHEPEAVDENLLRQLHDPAYVDAFLTGTPEKLATMSGFKPWSEQLRNAVLKIQGGQLLAAELAMQTGVSANIAQGFHHAHYEYGGSFCTFNGLALVALKYPSKRIFVLDCDQHGGDGTAQFSQRLDNLFNFSIFGLACDCPSLQRSETRHIHREQGNFAKYTMAIYDGFRTAEQWQADLIIYQAGMDCHQLDPFGSSWFSTELIQRREELVFHLAKKYDIPVMFVLAGGYQNLPDLVSLHLKSFDAAIEVFYAA